MPSDPGTTRRWLNDIRHNIALAQTIDAERPQLKNLLAKLNADEVVIIPAVDRLSRETTDLLVIARDTQRADAGLRTLADR